MTDRVRNFVFTGVLARHAVRDMESAGLLHRRDVTEGERKEGDLFASVQETIRQNAIQMQFAYRVLFVLENIIRELITSRFSEIDGPAWFDNRASSAMKSRLQQRQESEQKNQWHTGRNRDPIYYLDFGDLARLITNNWDVFADLLPSQPWVQSRLDEAERSRNVIAHTNTLSSEEVTRLEMYLRDWIKQIG